MHKISKFRLRKSYKRYHLVWKRPIKSWDQIENGMSYDRLYETFQEIETFICLLALYIEMEPNLVEDLVSGTAENVKSETIIDYWIYQIRSDWFHMAVYLISYKLNTPIQHATLFNKTIQSYEGWMFHQESLVLLCTKDSSHQIYKQLKPCIAEEDTLFIVKIRNDMQGWLPPESWNWFSKLLNINLFI